MTVYIYFASQTNVGHPLVVSLWYFHPPGQSSARGRITSGHARPALARSFVLSLLIAPNIVTSRINASVRKRMKFHEVKSWVFVVLWVVFRFGIVSLLISKVIESISVVKESNWWILWRNLHYEER